MELKWNLEELFISDKSCLDSFKDIDTLIKKIEKYRDKTLDAESLNRLLDDYFVCLEKSYRCLVYGSLRFYQNVKSDETKDLKSAVEKKNNEVISMLSFVDQMILSCGKSTIMDFIRENSRLEKYRHYMINIYKKKEHIVDYSDTLEIKNSIDSLLKRYFEIINSIEFAPILVDGKETIITSSNVAKYLLANNRETRRQAFISLSEGYDNKKDELASLLNSLYQKRYELSKIEGYAGVLERTLDAENIDIKFLNELENIVENNRDGLRRYMEIKKRYLGIEDAHLYDLGMPFDFKDRKKYPLSEAIETILKALNPLGEKYLDSVKMLLNDGHIDASLDENKSQTMTFSWYGYSFLNYKESYNSLKNLIHEIGHSTNDLLSMDLPFPYRISTVFIGETASIINEILLNRYMIDHSECAEEKLFYLGKEVDNYLSSVFTQIRTTELERKLYNIVEKGEQLTSDIISKEYFKILKSYFGEDIIYDEECSIEWTRISHIFRWSFYTFKYASSLMIASTAYSNIKDGTLSLEKYIEFLSSGSRSTDSELLKILNIDIDESQILKKGFDTFYKDLEEINALLDELND